MESLLQQFRNKITEIKNLINERNEIASETPNKIKTYLILVLLAIPIILMVLCTCFVLKFIDTIYEVSLESLEAAKKDKNI